jgi:3-isopropylmalate/(R)-2-methylmalate dehydratase large subunit
VRAWVKRHGIKHFYDCGSGSIHHCIIEHKLWSPGSVIVGCDSHTPIYGALGVFATGIGNNSMAALGFPHGLGWFRVPETINVRFTGALQPGVTPRDISQYLVGHIGEDGAIYRALEFSGPFIEGLEVNDRLLFPLMTIDMGGKTGYVNPDAKTLAYAAEFGGPQQHEVQYNDPSVEYCKTVEIDVSQLVQPIDTVLGTPIQIAEVGGSTGGRIEDLRMLAGVLDGKRVHPDVRLQVVPATRSILLAALDEGLVETLVRAGATFYPPSCGSNQAANMGAMCEDEAMLSTQARNFPGRNGSPKSRHYLGSPLTVGHSAIAGVITSPQGG